MFGMISSSKLAQAGDFGTSISSLTQLIASDPKFFEAQGLLVEIYEYQKNYPAAIELRKKIEKLDPYNQQNLLSLGEDLKAFGDVKGAMELISQIKSFASNTTEYKQAVKDLS